MYGSVFTNQNVQNIVLINNSRTAWPAEMSFSDNLLQNASTHFSEQGWQ